MAYDSQVTLDFSERQVYAHCLFLNFENLRLLRIPTIAGAEGDSSAIHCFCRFYLGFFISGKLHVLCSALSLPSVRSAPTCTLVVPHLWSNFEAIDEGEPKEREDFLYSSR